MARPSGAVSPATTESGQNRTFVTVCQFPPFDVLKRLRWWLKCDVQGQTRLLRSGDGSKEVVMGRAMNFVGSLTLLWLCSFSFLLLAGDRANYFLPSFATLLAGVALLVSNKADLWNFFYSVQVRRVMFGFVPITLMGILGGKDAPDWSVVPPLVGLYMLSSAVIYRIDKTRADRKRVD